MVALLLVAQTGGGGQAQQIAASFGVDWPHFLAQLVSFAIVCALLYFFAYKRVLAMLELRRREIAESLANAEKIKAELLRTESERQRVIDEANAQALKLIEEARAAAARVGRDETQKALAAAEQILVKAREASAQDHARMLGELKREVGRLVVQTTAAVAGRVLTAEDQRNLNEQTARLLS
ncbi:MAG TPA: ATP synthase F0 subunit B [Vicinamibacteria bacterium]|nr:ATP synthase F0 subunit B [Vicinamibacteria bacterium]